MYFNWPMGDVNSDFHLPATSAACAAPSIDVRTNSIPWIFMVVSFWLHEFDIKFKKGLPSLFRCVVVDGFNPPAGVDEAGAEAFPFLAQASALDFIKRFAVGDGFLHEGTRLNEHGMKFPQVFDSRQLAM